ncbi:MAG: carbonic anhydrase family protein [Rubrivivax sp.]|nr:carbonic anhydrase family protein [Rubrivivax sp.]
MTHSRSLCSRDVFLLNASALAVATALVLWSSLAVASDPATGKPEAKLDAGHGTKPRAAGDASSKVAAADSLDQLRERLAEKLGAAKPAQAGNPGTVRVTAKLETGRAASDGQGAAAPAPAAAARRPSAEVLAAVEAHRANKAMAGNRSTPAAHWGYNGESGPTVWGGLKPEFSTCAVGQRQSPIDIRGGIAVDLEPVQFDYRAGGFNVIDNGHTVQVNVASGNTIQVGGRRYELQQFHFHRPSEERINGRQYEMSVHLVHKDPEGRLAVVAVLLERGAAQNVVQAVWNNLPLEKGIEQPTSTVLDLNHLLPPDRGYYTYMGSLTTPPCSEGVLWMVMRQPVPVAQGQIDIFSRLYPMNARPVQSASGRLIKQSQ